MKQKCEVPFVYEHQLSIKTYEVKCKYNLSDGVQVMNITIQWRN